MANLEAAPQLNPPGAPDGGRRIDLDAAEAAAAEPLAALGADLEVEACARRHAGWRLPMPNC
jgi:hypothetical protein